MLTESMKSSEDLGAKQTELVEAEMSPLDHAEPLYAASSPRLSNMKMRTMAKPSWPDGRMYAIFSFLS